jgi:hypothetical protein
MASLASSLNGLRGAVIVEGFAAAGDKDKNAAALDRANRAREKLIRSGLDPKKVVVVANVKEERGGVRIAEAQVAPRPREDTKALEPPAAGKPGPVVQDPIGTSHFESMAAMSVPRGTSAMVSILSADTEGEIVYLYDPETERGNAQYPFRAVRVKNPTDSVLESGPVTVFGDGKFIGEGLSEPVPAHGVAFVPFALDRQVVVETKHGERDEIAKILTVQRGVFQTEVQHKRARTLSLSNRNDEKATVYLRHTVAPGYTLSKAPENACKQGAACEKIAGAHLFRVEVPAHKTVDVEIEEETPVFRSMDIRSPAGLEAVRVYLSSAAVQGPLKEKVAELVKLYGDMTKIDQQIQTTREQMQEYRVRMDELHAQLVTLKAVKTAGPLMASLEKKMQEVSDRLSKATIDVVGYQEKLMIARIHFQDGVAELSLEKDGTSAAAAAAWSTPGTETASR